VQAVGRRMEWRQCAACVRRWGHMREGSPMPGTAPGSPAQCPPCRCRGARPAPGPKARAHRTRTQNTQKQATQRKYKQMQVHSDYGGGGGEEAATWPARRRTRPRESSGLSNRVPALPHPTPCPGPPHPTRNPPSRHTLFQPSHTSARGSGTWHAARAGGREGEQGRERTRSTTATRRITSGYRTMACTAPANGE
jgi:hypothetical protein